MHGLPDWYNLSSLDYEDLSIVWNDIIKKLYTGYEIAADEDFYVLEAKEFVCTKYIKVEGSLIVKGVATVYTD